MIVLNILGYFGQNKQNSYAALTSQFYLIIGMVDRLRKKWYIIYCVYNEPKLHNSTSKSRHICYTEKLQIIIILTLFTDGRPTDKNIRVRP